MEEQAVVFVGVRPEGKGGIASVLQLYKKHFGKSRFFASRTYASVWVDTLIFPFTCLRFAALLVIAPEIRFVHIHGASNGSFYRKYVLFLIAKYPFRKKVIYHMHGGGFHQFYKNAPGIVKIWVRHFIRKADVLVCLSDSWKIFFAEHFRPNKIVMIPNTVEQVMPLEKKIQQRNVIFLFMGKIMEAKGIYDLLSATSRLQTLYPGRFEVWIAGDGAIQALEAFIKSNGLQDVVHYKGWVSGAEKEALLQQADVFVLPSYNEGMPVSILEAMARHLPVIATTVGGIPEQVKDGQSGVLIQPGDKEALHHAMEQFILSPALINEMGRVAAERVAEQFVFDITRQKLALIYDTLTRK